ncbi:MAG: N-acetylmuramoyl-L-alanine amidase [Lentisphaeria bacterium]|jgi:N-acetylmuramoyl-L-alanine amidase
MKIAAAKPLLLLLLSLAQVSCASAQGPAGRTVQLGGVNYHRGSNLAAFYGLSAAAGPKTLALTGRGRQMTLTEQRREATCNQVAVSLSHPAQRLGKSWLVSDPDVRLLFDPIFRPQNLPRRRVRTIVLDPGHGGRDQGAAAGGILEKAVTLQIARRVAESLRKSGYTVHLTRTTDSTLELAQRPAIANRLRADLFVSIHVNATADRSVNGIETFFLPPRNTPSTYGTRPLTTLCRNHAVARYNTRLAYDLQRQLLAASGAADRGLKHANFAVLRDAACPAVLVEVGFLSHPKEGPRLGTRAAQGRLATGIANGIRAYAQNVGQK